MNSPDRSPQIGPLERGVTRREFLGMVARAAGVIAAGVVVGAVLPDFLFSSVEARRFRTAKEVLNAIWRGEIKPTWLEIEGYAAGQIQVREWNQQQGDWNPEYFPTFAWIHRWPENPLALRGLFFIHRDNLLLAEKDLGEIPWGARVKIYANWQHDPGAEVLVAKIGRRAIYPASQIDNPNDPLVRDVARSQRTIAIVTCHPPNFQGENPPQRLVYYAWCSLPRKA